MSQVQLAIRLLDGQSKRLEFPATATLADVRAALGPQPAAFVFSTTFPTHRFTPEEERATLADSKLAPKAALTLQTAERREQQHSTEPPPAAPGVVHAVTSSQQLKSLQQGGKPVVVDFFAVWCGPCQRFKPTFAAMAKEYAGRVTFAAVDVDEAQELAQEFKVAAMPTFVVVSGGREVGRVKGADEGALRAAIQKATAEEVKIDWGDEAAAPPAAPAVPAPAATPTAAAAPAPDNGAERKRQEERAARRRRMEEKVERERREREEAERREKIEAEQRRRAAVKRPKAAAAPQQQPEPAAAPASASASASVAAAAAAAAGQTEEAEEVAKEEPQKEPRVPKQHTQARLSIRLLDGRNHRQVFAAESTLDDVRTALAEVETGKFTFTTNFPVYRFSFYEETKSLRECKLVPSGTLILERFENSSGSGAGAQAGGSWAGWGLGLLNPANWLGGGGGGGGGGLQASSAAPAVPAEQERKKRDDAAEDDALRKRNNGNGTAFEYEE